MTYSSSTLYIFSFHCFCEQHVLTFFQPHSFFSIRNYNISFFSAQHFCSLYAMCKLFCFCLMLYTSECVCVYRFFISVSFCFFNIFSLLIRARTHIQSNVALLLAFVCNYNGFVENIQKYK